MTDASNATWHFKHDEPTDEDRKNRTIPGARIELEDPQGNVIRAEVANRDRAAREYLHRMIAKGIEGADNIFLGKAPEEPNPDAVKRLAGLNIEERAQEDMGREVEIIRKWIEIERGYIVHTVLAYAQDCERRAAELEESGLRERKRLWSTGHVEQAEDVRKMQVARSAAFSVRAAIAADIAYKVETLWGRNPDGTPQTAPDAEASDVVRDAGKEADRLNKAAAQLKTR